MSVYSIGGNTLADVFDLNGSSLAHAYDIFGEDVFGGQSIDYTNYTVSTSYRSLGIANCQGFDIYDDVLFQFRANGTSVTDTVVTAYFSTGQILNTVTISADHGDSASFSNEFQTAGDDFPLLYVTADTTPAVIYVDKVTSSSATLVRTLAFPQSAGYYGAGAFDFENDICYLLSYKENNYTSDNGGANTTVVSKWDLSTLTDNGDGTYTPAFINQYERPFIYVMQGLTFHDGMIWIASGYGGNPSYIYAIDPADGTLLYTINLNTTTEVEGVAFLSDTQMVVGFQGGRYDLYTFGTSV